MVGRDEGEECGWQSAVLMHSSNGLSHADTTLLGARGERGKGILWGLMYEIPNPIHEGATLMT